MQSICVFCGSSKGKNSKFEEYAKWVGAELARKGITLVYGGGKVGLMGTTADACLKAGGKVVGIIPNFLAKNEIAHDNLTELIKVNSMHERKLKMSQLADGFLALPGGFGTLEEFCEIITWVQLNLVSKPIGLLNIDGYYDHLLAQFEVMIENQLLKKTNLSFFVHSKSKEDLLVKMSELAKNVNSLEDKFIHT